MSAFDEETMEHLRALKGRLSAAPPPDPHAVENLAVEILDDLADLFEAHPRGPTTDDLQEHYGEPAALVRAAMEKLKTDGAVAIVFDRGTPRLVRMGSAVEAPPSPPDLTPEAPRVSAPNLMQRPPGRPRSDVADRLLALLKARFSDQGQFEAPTQKQVQEHLGCSGYLAFDAYARLRERGEIVLVERGNGRTPTVYRWPGADQVPAAPPTAPKLEPSFRAGIRPAAKVSTLSRFSTAKAEPERVVPLRPDHPALVQERTLFPTTVVSPWESPALLVSGHNNGKLGGEITKGEWAGMPLYHLTLEERATCPRSCAVWDRCMGNGMHMSRRHDHRDPHFLPLLEAELWMLSRKHPGGFAVRLHTLGDFYSLDYVRFWAQAVDTIPGLHAYGYTGCLPTSEDEREAEIGKAILTLTEAAWDHFAIRFSGHPGPQGAVVVEREFDRDWLLMCPQQNDKTATCGTCGLCWSEGARDKTIAFLLHGPKRGGGDDSE